jgi:ribokinase
MQFINIVVAGGVNIDTTYLVEKLPSEGETVSASGRKQSLGGKGLNQAVAARRAGASVAIVGATGAGPGGKEIREFLVNEGIEIQLLSELPNAKTGRAIIAVDPDANNLIIVDLGANLQADATMVDQLRDAWSGIQFVVANGEAPEMLVESLFIAARQNEVTTVWNPSPMPSDPSIVLRHTDVLVVNQSEANHLGGESQNIESLVDTLAKSGPSEIVLTLGADGCVVHHKGELHRITAPLVNAVDPTAAGDTFLGYYLAERVQGSTPQQAAKIATVAASICVQSHGAATSIPRRFDISEELKDAENADQ